MKDLRNFLKQYGERGYYVLKAILEVAKENWGRGALGDIDFKSVRRKLETYGLEYNPALLLSRLEKDYRVIETTYRSTTQHWWRIVDLEAIEEVVAEYEGRPIEETGSLPPRARLLRLQFYSLEPERILTLLKRVQRGLKVSRRVMEEIIFNKLPKLVNFLEEASEGYFEELSSEISMAEEILALAESIVLSKRVKVKGGLQLSFIRETNYDASP